MCAGVDVPAGHTLQEFYLSKNEGEAKKTYEAGRERIKKLKDSTKKKKGGRKVKVAVEEKAVQLGMSVCVCVQHTRRRTHNCRWSGGFPITIAAATPSVLPTYVRIYGSHRCVRA